MFIFPAKSTTIPSSSSLLQMIGVVPRQIITQKRIIQARIDDDYYAVADAQIDLNIYSKARYGVCLTGTCRFCIMSGLKL